MTPMVLINGKPSDGRIAVFDSSVLRGDGCFEVLKSYAGRPFALEEHLERLRRSAAALEIELPELSLVSAWIETAARDCGDCAVRVVVTRGSSVSGETGEPLVIVFAHPWERRPGPARLMPIAAPWHSAGIKWALSGAKILSYAPNLSATREATAAGFDDAVLVSGSGEILEGPTFSIVWVVGDVVETPTLDLGILDSITRRLVLDDARTAGFEVVEGVWGLDRLTAASEVMALSTIREVQPVSALGELTFLEGAVTAQLARAFAQRVNPGGSGQT